MQISEYMVLLLSTSGEVLLSEDSSPVLSAAKTACVPKWRMGVFADTPAH